MGVDHAGILFNKVMGNQASDGAYFTRPAAADIACRLTLDILEENPPKHLAFNDAGNSLNETKVGEVNSLNESKSAKKVGSSNLLVDWTSAKTWRGLKTLDPAVGSGILLAALLAEMKRRARLAGADEQQIASLHRLAVEEILIGMEINPVSLQLAAAALTLGNIDIPYQKMRLHLMPYGPQKDGSVKAGTLELLSQKAIVERKQELNLPDNPTKAKAIKLRKSKVGVKHHACAGNDVELEDAVKDAKDCQIIITNPPFTNRVKMGEKFKDHFKKRLQKQVDGLEQMLVDNDLELEKFVEKNSIGPLFASLGEKCANQQNGIVTLFEATIAMTGPSKIDKRKLLAKRFHIHTILTVHEPGNVAMSQDCGLNDSILIMQRNSNVSKPPTRFINLDRFPGPAYQVEDLFQFLDEMEGQAGRMRCEWGEVSYWPRERIERGDWTPAIWRSPELAEAAADFAECELPTMRELGLSPEVVGAILRSDFDVSNEFTPGSFPILKSKSETSQTTIQSQPDEWRVHKKRNQNETAKILSKCGHLLITFGQDTGTARLVAVADEKKYVGDGWLQVRGLTADQAKALAVFLNSTPGRLQLLRNAGKKLTFPQYTPRAFANIRVPDVLNDGEVCRVLLECWEDTKNIKVPQYRDGDDWDRKNAPRNPQEKPKDWLTGQAAASAVEESKVGVKHHACKVAASEAPSVSGGGQDSEKLRSSVRLACLNPRPLWDACVARVMRGNPLFEWNRLCHLRSLLHREPHIRGKAYHELEDE